MMEKKEESPKNGLQVAHQGGGEGGPLPTTIII